MNYRILTERRPTLARQSFKISIFNYFLAALVGCSSGSLVMALLEHVNNGYWANIFGLAFGIAIYLLFSLPFALLGLLPVALFGEVLARKTRMHPIAIAVVAAVASVPIALWMTPGVRLPYRAFVGVGFGLVVTASWVLLSFRTDGFAAILESADRA